MLKESVLRPIVLFAAAYTTIGVLHEVAHAVTAYALNVPATLYHLHVNIDPAERSLNERTIIGAAGPVFCLVLGSVCWLASRKVLASRAELPLLYLAWFGIVTFFGNLMSTPFVGDFSALAELFALPMSARYAAAVAGAVCISVLSFYMGTELRKWSPVEATAARATVGMIVLPVIIGTAAAILIFLPMPADWVPARVGESAFWIFATIGTFVSRKPFASRPGLRLGWPDITFLLVAALTVRLIAGGIVLTP